MAGRPTLYSLDQDESAHRLFSKIPFRRSNKKNPIPQMMKSVEIMETLPVQPYSALEVQSRKKKEIEFEFKGDESTILLYDIDGYSISISILVLISFLLVLIFLLFVSELGQSQGIR